MRTVRGVPHPQSFEDCRTLMAAGAVPRYLPEKYRPITDEFILLGPTPDTHILVCVGIPLLTFHRTGELVFNSCGILVAEPGQHFRQGHPLIQSLYDRLNRCLPSGYGTFMGTNGLHLMAIRSPAAFPRTLFKDFTVLKVNDPSYIYQPPADHRPVVTMVGAQATTAPTNPPTPTFPPEAVAAADTAEREAAIPF